MTHASLFSGIGGFDLAAQWMGWDNVFQVEIDNYCQKVLQKNFPNVARYGDIKQFDGSKYAGQIDILTGGFPCQPFSSAGQRRGTEDDRHLWPQMLRIIREIQPSYIVGENVHGILNWSRGLVFEEVQANLEIEGYEVTSVILPACAKNAPHRRDRVWFIAYSGSIRRGRIEEIALGHERNGRGKAFSESVPHSNERTFNEWTKWPTESPICRGDDGLPDRVDRIKSLGNAIVPQVAFEIFKAIEKTI